MTLVVQFAILPHCSLSPSFVYSQVVMTREQKIMLSPSLGDKDIR